MAAAPRKSAVEDPQDRDRRFMAQALELARAVPVRPWPNPPVGAVVVRGETVVGRGAHHGPGRAHAETAALAEAGERARGATLYVTLEPCNHQGRTPPCAPAVAAAGIRRVVAALRDPNPTVPGGGCRHLRERGLEVVCGVRAAEALELIWPFAVTRGFERPYLELKTAVSLDGRFAPPGSGRGAVAPVYLTGEAARRQVHRRRRELDLVLVGTGTVRADRPRLDSRLADGDPAGAEPLAGYLDRTLSWSGGLDRERYLVLAGDGAREAAQRAAIERDGGEILFCAERDGRLELTSVLAAVRERGLHTVLVEGGPRLSASLLGQGLVDRWLAYQGSLLLGAGEGWPEGAPTADRCFSLTRCEPVGGDLLAVWDRRDFRAELARLTLWEGRCSPD